MSTPEQHSAVLAAAAGGDDEALEVLVRAYHDRVYRFGVRVCRDRFDADDAVQQAFVKLAKRPDVQRDPGALSWLMSVVRNTCRRLLRPFLAQRQRLGAATDVEPVASPQLDPKASLERWRLVHSVHQAIAALDGPYREVLVMRDVEGLTGEEVCRALNLTEAAMKSRLHRARAMVRELIGRSERPGAGAH